MKNTAILILTAAAMTLAACKSVKIPTLYDSDGVQEADHALDNSEVKSRDCVTVGLKAGECNALICCPD